eukprot:c10203_g1_i3.p2 GENE.c10203_g1_i3~~c10203_g1_i3.p2  ORF type:complete len:103 (-),score=7.37 c10203_g1_i3:223-531(-)
MGTRFSDPHGTRMSTFEPSSANWPQFMRVNPILHWSYSLVWSFLRSNNLPYVSLYDLGYTSLGGVHDTKPNPLLKRPDGEGFLPAFELPDPASERHGRGAQS